MTTEASGTNMNTKVARVIREYDLDGMGANLEAAWTGEAGERTSLRDLADEFNEAVLEAALRESGISSLSVDVSTTYEALRGESGSAATRARRRLEREGVDVDELTGDFVTHQAIHTYLTQGARGEPPSGGRRHGRPKGRDHREASGTGLGGRRVGHLVARERGELDRGDYDVLVDVRAVCPNCGTDAPVGELIRRGGCGCTSEAETDDE